MTVDEDALRDARRDSLRNLLDRLQRMGLTETEAHLLRQHVEAETRDADIARAVARSNLRHVRTIVPELERAEAERERADEAARRALEQRQEMAAERYAWQERGDRAEAAIARVRKLADRIRQGAPWTANHDDIARHIEAALDAALNPPKEQP